MKRDESILQSECVRWFRYQYPKDVIFAIPNGGKRDVGTAIRLNHEGVLAGVADLFIMRGVCGDFYSHGLFIEMKVGNNKQTDNQKEFEQKCITLGYTYAVCYSFDEFKALVNNYLNN